MPSDTLQVVQYNQGNESLVPLVLLHDGGGTIYSYHALGPLHRNVYGISNPNFESDKAWEGGIPEMAQSYASMIRKKIPHGQVLLGGWSFGGLLAIELSKIFEDDEDFEIAGLVLIDTPYPKGEDGFELRGMNIMPEIPGVRPRVRSKIHKSLHRARDMIATWQLPLWGDIDEGYESDSSVSSYGSASSTSSNGRKGPPPAVLLRAVDKVEGLEALRSASARRGSLSAIPLVDVFRADPSLGWKEYNNSFIQVVWDIPGDHFNIFTAPYVDQVTEKLLSACYYLGK